MYSFKNDVERAYIELVRTSATKLTPGQVREHLENDGYSSDDARSACVCLLGHGVIVADVHWQLSVVEDDV